MVSVWDILAFALFTILILLALGGNVLVCAAVFWDRKLRRQPENLFLVSLAVSDLLVSVLVMVFAAANDLLGYWPFGGAYCQFWICFDITCSTASILNLCAIAFDRYLHISRPMTYTRYSNKGVIMISILLVWLLSSLTGSAQIIFGVASGGGDAMETLDSMIPRLKDKGSLDSFEDGDKVPNEVCHLMLQPVYAIFSSTLSFFLPATIMVLLYTKLYLYARKHASHTALHYANNRRDHDCRNGPGMCLLDANNGRSCNEVDGCEGNRTADCCTSLITTVTAVAAENQDSAAAIAVPSAAAVKATIKTSTKSASCSEQTCNTEFVEVSDESRRLNANGTRVNHSCTISHTGRSVSDQKARFTLGVIMGTFLLSWLPFFIVNIWRSLYPDFFPQLVFQVVTWLGYSNSSANPIIYGTFNRDFRRAFKDIVFYFCDKDGYKRRPFHTDYNNKS